MNLNKCFVLGYVCKDPEIKATKSGNSVATFSMATNRVWKDGNGEKQEEVCFHNIVFFGKVVDSVIRQYVSKGSLILVEGRINNRSYEDQKGGKRYISEVVGEGIQLGPRKSQEDFPSPRTQPIRKEKSIYDDEIREKGELEGDLPSLDFGDDEIRPEDLPF
jgi:single-strand DNA-binding protein